MQKYINEAPLKSKQNKTKQNTTCGANRSYYKWPDWFCVHISSSVTTAHLHTKVTEGSTNSQLAESHACTASLCLRFVIFLLLSVPASDKDSFTVLTTALCSSTRQETQVQKVALCFPHQPALQPCTWADTAPSPKMPNVLKLIQECATCTKHLLLAPEGW